MTIPAGRPAGLTPSQVNSSDTAQWRQIVRQALADARCASPAFLVEDMDPDTQTVTAQIAIQERVRTPKGAQWWDIPPIIRVPVVLPRGGGFALTLPLKKGDSGLLVFCDACFDAWWQNGTDGAPKAMNLPADAPPSGSQTQFEVRRHYVHDCGFLPGMWSQKRLVADYSADSLQARTEDGSSVVDVSASGVALKGASVTAANGGPVQALVTDAFYQWFQTNILPFLASKGYLGPAPPANSETTVLKGQ